MPRLQELQQKLEAAGLGKVQLDVVKVGDGYKLGFDISTLIMILSLLPKLLPLIQEFLEIIRQLDDTPEPDGPNLHGGN